jgi:hypothetical protein
MLIYALPPPPPPPPGATYAFIAHKNSVSEPIDGDFYDPHNKISRDLLARFNDINPSKLREGTWTNDESPLAVVDNKCTIAKMIRINTVSLGVNINDLPPEGTDAFFSIDRRVVDACMARYEEEQNVGFHDMRNFQMTLTRVDSPKNPANPAGICDNIARRNKTDLAHADDTRLNNKYTISGIIEIQMNLFGTGTVGGQ